MRTIYEYIYDDNGVLVERRIHNNMVAYPYEWTYGVTKYSYDSLGKLQGATFSGGYVYAFYDSEGNRGAVPGRYYRGEENKEIEYFEHTMDEVFGRESRQLAEHDWLVDTSMLELEWGYLDENNENYQTAEWKEKEYIYTDVYLYSSEN